MVASLHRKRLKYKLAPLSCISSEALPDLETWVALNALYDPMSSHVRYGDYPSKWLELPGREPWHLKDAIDGLVEFHLSQSTNFLPPEMQNAAYNHSQEKLRSRLQSSWIEALSKQNVTGAPCSRPCTPYGTVKRPTRVADEHIQETSDGS